MLALNVPDKYALERLGHATNNMLKTVYQHTMKEKQDTVADLVDGYFATILDETLDGMGRLFVCNFIIQRKCKALRINSAIHCSAKKNARNH